MGQFESETGSGQTKRSVAVIQGSGEETAAPCAAAAPPNAAFIAQLLACRDNHIAYRARRRLDPAAARERYLSLSHQPRRRTVGFA